MKRIKLVVIAFVALIIVGVAFLSNKTTYKSFNEEKGVNAASIPEKVLEDNEEDPRSENPIERLEFEAGQLVDPTTGEIPYRILDKEIEYAKKNLNLANVNPNGVSPFSLGSVPSATTQNSENFTNMGPYNIGGRTRAIGIDIADENVIIAGGISGGIWKTTDQGQSWNRTSSLQHHPAISSLVQDQRSGKTNEWYYSTGEFSGNSASASGAFYLGNGLYKSVDNGDSWELIASTAQPGTSGTDVVTNRERFTITHQLAIDYSEPTGTEIYAAGPSEIIRSTDGFETFEVVLGENNSGSNWSDVAVSSTGMVYASIANTSFNGSNGVDGLFKSPDGINWTQIEPQTGFPSTFRRMEIAIDPNNEDRVYFVGLDRLFVYTESSNTWADLSANIKPSGEDVGQGHGSQGGYDLYVAVHPSNEDIIFLGGVNLMRTTNRFTTSAATAQVGGYNNDGNPNSYPRYPDHHPDNHNYAFFPSDPNRMLSANDGGVYLAENNTTNTNTINPIDWTPLNNGYVTNQIYHASINQFDLGDQQIIAGMQDNGTWAKFAPDPEEIWTEVFSGDGAFTGISYNSLYASSQNGNLVRFELDNANVYQFAGNISPTPDDNDYLFINPYYINPIKQDQLFVAARGRVFYTNDIRTNPGSGEWSEINHPNLTGQQVSAFGMSFDPEGVLYFGTRFGRLFKVTGTEDVEGNIEATQLSTTGMPVGNVSSISVDPTDADKVIVTLSNYGIVSVWYTEDGGDTWGSISGNLEENPQGTGAGPSVRASAIMPDGVEENYYFIGTSVGLYMTKELDGDNTVWVQQASQAIGNVVVSNIMTRPIEGMIMASTHGNGSFVGFYDTRVVPNVNYSFSSDQRSVELRANVSFDSNAPLSYQWLKDGAEIDGANEETLTVIDGGDYQVRMTIGGVEGTGVSNTVSINLDGQGPIINSITRFNPATEEVSGDEVVFQVTFDEPVVNIGTNDFETSGDASGTVESVVLVTNTNIYNVTVNGIGGSGTLGLAVASSSDIADESGNAFSGTIESSETYNVTDNTAPSAAITRSNPTSEVTDQFRVTFLVSFSENVQNVDITDFTLPNAIDNAELVEVLPVQGTRVFSVEVSQIISDGVVSLAFSSSQDIADGAGNAFSGEITTQETYTIENVIASVESPVVNIDGIKVDANPSSGEFVLTLPDDFAGPVEYNVINASGVSVRTGGVSNYQPASELKVDLRNQADGLFIFEAVGTKRKATIKLLKRTR